MAAVLEQVDAPIEAAPEAPAVPFEPGIVTDLPADDYFRIEALSSSACKLLLRSPAHYWWEKNNPSEPSKAQSLGTAVHLGILEPHRFDAQVVLMPDFNRRTNAGKADAEAWERENAGKVWLNAQDMARARSMIGAVQRHPGAQRLLDGGQPEVTLMWRDAQYGVPCKARVDFHRDDRGMVDLKTTLDASPEGFGRQVANLLYHVQAAHYWSGAEHLLDESPPFWAWIAVENEAPYCVGTYVVQSDALRIGMRKQERAVIRYAEATKRGFWWGYPDTIEPINLPGWALKESV